MKASTLILAVFLVLAFSEQIHSVAAQIDEMGMPSVEDLMKQAGKTEQQSDLQKAFSQRFNEFMQIDKNEDGYFTKEEMNAFLIKRYGEEVATDYEIQKELDQLFTSSDKDGDGKLTLKEYLGFTDEELKSIEMNPSKAFGDIKLGQGTPQARADEL